MGEGSPNGTIIHPHDPPQDGARRFVIRRLSATPGLALPNEPGSQRRGDRDSEDERGKKRDHHRERERAKKNAGDSDKKRER